MEQSLTELFNELVSLATWLENELIMGKKITLWSLFRNAKYRWVSMRKYKMCLPLWYVLRHVFTFEKYSSGKLWQFRFICTYGFDIDFRGDNFLDYFLTENEKEKFWMRWFSVRN